MSCAVVEAAHWAIRRPEPARDPYLSLGDEPPKPTCPPSAASAPGSTDDTGGREVSLPDEDSLIEEIMWPYPTARLRARRRREATRLLVARQARESRRQDATKCNTLQDNEAASDPATKASGARPERPVLPTAVMAMRPRGRR